MSADFGPFLLLYVAIAGVLAWATWADIKTRRVPARCWPNIVALGCAAFFPRLFNCAWEPCMLSPVNLMLMGAGFGVVLMFAGLMAAGGMGAGDFKILLALGFASPWPLRLTLMLALIAAPYIIGAWLRSSRRVPLFKYRPPFMPAILTAFLLSPFAFGALPI